MTVVLVILFVLAAAGAAGAGSWALSLRKQLAAAEEELRRRVIPAPQPPRAVSAPPPVPVRPPAPEPLPELAAPSALPNVADSEPDSTVDGARLGRLVVRAAAIRGEHNRLDGLARRQAAATTLLSRFDPPVVLSAVAAGLPGRDHSQLGAVQACKTLHGQLSERATALALDAAWKDAGKGSSVAGDELRRLLRAAMLEVGKSLTLAAKSRNLEPETVATSLTFMLSRLGDIPRRQHLVVGVGSGALLRVSGDGKMPAEYEETAEPLATLPEKPDLLSWRTVETGPGDVLVLCTGTTAAFLKRDKDKGGPVIDWHGGSPDLVRFFWYLNQQDTAREDHAAVAIWELPPPVTNK